MLIFLWILLAINKISPFFKFLNSISALQIYCSNYKYVNFIIFLHLLRYFFFALWYLCGKLHGDIVKNILAVPDF